MDLRFTTYAAVYSRMLTYACAHVDLRYIAVRGHIYSSMTYTKPNNARMWTSGYDIFAPSEPVVFHLWTRDYRPSFSTGKLNWSDVC